MTIILFLFFSARQAHYDDQHYHGQHSTDSVAAT